MRSVPRLSTALALVLTGAFTGTAGGQSIPAANASNPTATDRFWFVESLGTTSSTARQEFLAGLREADAERASEARQHFNAAVAADPSFAIGHLYAGYYGGSPSAYRKHLDEAIRLVNQATPVEQLWIRAEQKGADNDVNGQLAIAEQLVQMTPTDPRALGYLSGVQVAANKRAEARATLVKVTQMNPSFVQGWLQLGNSYLLNEPRDAAKAEDAIGRAVAIAPNDAIVHDYMGDVYRAEGKLAEARNEYTRQAELAPTDGGGFIQRGHVNSYLGNFDEARADYARGVQLSDPANKPFLASLGALVSVYAGDASAAEAELDRIAANVDPANPNPTGGQVTALSSEALIALDKKHVDVATRTIDQLKVAMRQQAAEGRTDAAKRNAEAGIDYWEGRLAAVKGDYTTARQKAQDMMKLVEQDQNPRKNEGAHELLAFTDFAQGNFQSAVDHFAQASPDDNYLWYYRGLALEKLGRTAEAKEFFKRSAQYPFNGPGTALSRKEAAKKIG